MHTPFFDAEETNLLDKFTGPKDLSEFGHLVCLVDDADKVGADVVALSASYLITNLLMMRVARKRILKLIELRTSEDADGQLHAVLNGLRYHCAGDYSQLENFKQWYADVQSRCELSPVLLNRLTQLSDFLVSSELTTRDIGKRRAETFLSTRVNGHWEGQGIEVEEQSAFYVKLKRRSDDSEIIRTISQALVYKSFVFSSSFSNDVVVMKFNGGDVSSSLRDWSYCMESFLGENMLGLTT